MQLTNRLGRSSGQPQWSPDGRCIAFCSQGQDGHWGIWVVEASGGRPKLVTPEPSDAQEPSWSRDGRWIYFQSDRAGKSQIWRIAFAGGQAEQVTQNGGHYGLESADGETLFYDKSDGSPLFAKPLVGGPERQVLDFVARRGFVVVEDGIYYIGRLENRHSPLRFYQFSTRASRLLTSIEGTFIAELTVSPDRKTFLFRRDVYSGYDLMLIENFR